MRKFLLLTVAAVLAVMGAVSAIAPANAAIVTEPVVYTLEGQPYEGYFALNQGAGEHQPLVLLIHDWNGLGDYEMRRAQMLAEQGYAAFAADLYGQGIRPSNPEESQAESGKLYADRDTLRQRLQASLEQARRMPGVDGDRVVAIGYCFGGAAVLELARSGAEVEGYGVFHGSLATPAGQDYSQTQGSLLIMHGSNDPVAPMGQVAQLANELTQAGVDFKMEIYGGARHAFTVWGANQDSSRYDIEADLKSWQALMAFLQQQLG